VDRHVAPLLFVKDEKGELGHPEEIQFVISLKQVLQVGHLESDAPQDFAGRLPLVGREKDEVAGFDVEFAAQGLDFRVGHAFDEGRAPGRAIGIAGLDVGQPLRTYLQSTDVVNHEDCHVRLLRKCVVSTSSTSL
jgi:hypothetical protein